MSNIYNGTEPLPGTTNMASSVFFFECIVCIMKEFILSV